MVTRSALQNAASIAKNILTTEAVVAEMPEKQAGNARRHARRRDGLLGRPPRLGVPSLIQRERAGIAGPFAFL